MNMKKYVLRDLNMEKINQLRRRPSTLDGEAFVIARKIARSVKKDGDRALVRYARELDNFNGNDFTVSQREIIEAGKNISESLKKALSQSRSNIYRFHKSQLYESPPVYTTAGVKCFSLRQPIKRVGLYIPGGTAPLVSTVLMLAIPAGLAGCPEIVLCTPPQSDGSIPAPILFAADLCGVSEIYKIGGAQAISMMAYGTESVHKVDKIFGPGNKFVAAAKSIVSADPEGAAIDLPAGPSEVLIICDAGSNEKFVAADLLSQAEHDVNSQVVLVTTSEMKAEKIMKELKSQIGVLARKEIIEISLSKSFVLIVPDIESALSFSNCYAPEHLILNIKNCRKYISQITSAGSVFLGAYSCESAGDYASGTNHVLPTYGLAKSYSGLSVSSFQKEVFFQEVTREGLINLNKTIGALADAEGLAAHKRAASIRLEKQN